jgi:hypothetical protein
MKEQNVMKSILYSNNCSSFLQNNSNSKGMREEDASPLSNLVGNRRLYSFGIRLSGPVMHLAAGFSFPKCFQRESVTQCASQLFSCTPR